MAKLEFVSFLVDETLRLQKSGTGKLSSLELKLKDYGLSYFRGEFIPQNQTLRFKTEFGNLDAPINWSIFASSTSLGDHTLLDEQNDTDYLFSVIKSAWKIPLEKLLVTHADGYCFVIGLKAGEENHLHDLLNPQEWLKTG